MKKQTNNQTVYVLSPDARLAGLAVSRPILAWQQQLEALLVKQPISIR